MPSTPYPSGSPPRSTISSVQGYVDQIERSYTAGTLSTGTGVERLVFPAAGTIQGCTIAADTAPTGATIIVDVNLNGTTIYTTQANRPTIAISGNQSTETTPDTTAIAAGDYLTYDIDQVGSTIAGSDLTVAVRWRAS